MMSRRILTEFQLNGLPINREGFALFASKFDIKTSQQTETREFENAKNDYLKSLPVLNLMQGIPQTEKLRGMIQNLETLEGDELGDAIKAIEAHLVGADQQSGELDNILDALTIADQENASKGIASNHFEQFTQSARDFSPVVSKRISIYIERMDEQTADHQQPANASEAIIASALPASATL